LVICVFDCAETGKVNVFCLAVGGRGPEESWKWVQVLLEVVCIIVQRGRIRVAEPAVPSAVGVQAGTTSFVSFKLNKVSPMYLPPSGQVPPQGALLVQR
jgi:hypothetical protein